MASIPPAVSKEVRRARVRSKVADYTMICGTVAVIVILSIGLTTTLGLLAAVHDGQAVTHRTLDTLEGALAAAPAAQDEAVRHLIGCPKAPAKCPSMIELLRAQSDGIAQLLSRPVSTRTTVIQQGRTRIVFVTRTVVVCRTPSGKPCG